MDKNIKNIIENSWKKIALSWPLQNFIAANPLRGFEHLPFQEALGQAAFLFEQQDVPEKIECINCITITWLQQFFDQGQATFMMPGKNQGLYRSWYKLARYDEIMHQGNSENIAWFEQLPSELDEVVEQCLRRLGIDQDQYEKFITLLLTALPGWAAYVHYCADWSDQKQYEHITQEYVAMRLVITCMVWQDAKLLLEHDQSKVDVADRIGQIESNEKKYRTSLLYDLQQQNSVDKSSSYDAQFVFCIDTRSEPFRKHLETVGNYQTYSCAGFFLVPACIEQIDGQTYASCPVLLKPQYTVKQFVQCPENDCDRYLRGSEILFLIKEFYRSLKYTFVTPFILVEILGPAVGIWILLSTFVPTVTRSLYNFAVSCIRKVLPIQQSLKDVSVHSQSESVHTVLQGMGLVDNFAKVVVIVGHGSNTRNNAYATSLDCGACGGRQGGNNAQIFAQMANNREVRSILKDKGIVIPETTIFVGAQHDTTTDKVELYDQDTLDVNVKTITKDLEVAGSKNAECRMKQFTIKNSVMSRSADWAQVRPEWGLARNASMIIGSRDRTQHLDLGGRTFLHSYDWRYDEDGSMLTLILTAPMIVAQWINSQYLLSTINNVAYGSGSKATLNVTGKFGVMQGNASDLMHGLSLQSLYKSDEEPYHELQRLLVVIYAPQDRVISIIKEHNKVKELIVNEWIQIVCVDDQGNKSQLNQQLEWNEL